MDLPPQYGNLIDLGEPEGDEQEPLEWIPPRPVGPPTRPPRMSPLTTPLRQPREEPEQELSDEEDSSGEDSEDESYELPRRKAKKTTASEVWSSSEEEEETVERETEPVEKSKRKTGKKITKKTSDKPRPPPVPRAAKPKNRSEYRVEKVSAGSQGTTVYFTDKPLKELMADEGLKIDSGLAIITGNTGKELEQQNCRGTFGKTWLSVMKVIKTQGQDHGVAKTAGVLNPSLKMIGWVTIRKGQTEEELNEDVEKQLEVMVEKGAKTIVRLTPGGSMEGFNKKQIDMATLKGINMSAEGVKMLIIDPSPTHKANLLRQQMAQKTGNPEAVRIINGQNTQKKVTFDKPVRGKRTGAGPAPLRTIDPKAWPIVGEVKTHTGPQPAWIAGLNDHTQDKEEQYE